MIIEKIEDLVDESEYISEIGIESKYAYYGAMSALTLSPLTVIGYAIYRYFTGVKRWEAKLKEYESGFKNAPTPEEKMKFKLKIIKAKAKLEQARGRVKQEKIRFMQRIEKEKFKLSQYKPPYSEEDKQKMDKIKNKIAKAQAVLDKHGIKM